MSKQIVVVGGGVAGLTTAHHLSKRSDFRVTVLESSDRLGGKIRTTEFRGRNVEEGADAFIVRLPFALQLCDELGLADAVIHPQTSSAGVMLNGRVRDLPQGLVMGVPPRILPMLRSRLVSPAGLARASLDFVKKDDWPGSEETIGQIVSRRLGSQVARNVVDPLLGGIYASDIDRLSARATFPQLEDAARRGRSLMLSLRRMQKRSGADPSAPIFGSLDGGLGQVIDALERSILRNGGEVRRNTAVRSVETSARRGSSIIHLDNELIEADAVVLATPAFVAGDLLGGEARQRLSAIAYSSVLLATMDLAPGSTNELKGSGLLVAKDSQRLVTAVSYGSNKWPSWIRDAGSTLRVSGGHIGNSTVMDMTDDEVEAAFCTELEQLVGLKQAPTAVRISRWPQAFPQYEPGHQRLIKSIKHDLALSHPGLLITGAAYEGIGIPACIRQGKETASALLRTIT